MICNICSGETSVLFTASVLFKHSVTYCRCAACGAIQTTPPYWLEEAYEQAITRTDIGLLSRNVRLSDQVYDLVTDHFDPEKKFLDYGGGYGILVRLLRDKGLDFYRQDPYCQNLFAVNHDITDLQKDKQQFEMITCFEVFEHIYDTMGVMAYLSEKTDNILLSTLLVPDQEFQSVEDWWYFAPGIGQHVTFYTHEALSHLGSKFGYRLYSNGESLHLFSKLNFERNPLLPEITWPFRILNKIVWHLASFRKKQRASLVPADLKKVMEQIKKQAG